MTVLLVIAIWVGASLLFAPAIGFFLSEVQRAYPAVQPARLAPLSRPSAARRVYARRRALHNSLTRKPLVQSEVG